MLSKRKIIATSLVVCLFSFNASAGLFTSRFKEIRKPSVIYKIDTKGLDLRVYEWTPNFNKNISCIFVAGTEKGGTACYPKK